MTAAKVTMRDPFPPEQIGTLPKAGINLSYVGHADITARLLDVDPEWTWEPMGVTAAGLPALDDQGNLWIRLTVNGVTRIGVGDGKNQKERIGDALRNAAMRFGAALELWAKGDRAYGEQHGDPERLDPLVEARNALRAACQMHGLDLGAVRDEFFAEYAVGPNEADVAQLSAFTQKVIDREAAKP